jgi:hypothetical protein
MSFELTLIDSGKGLAVFILTPVAGLRNPAPDSPSSVEQEQQKHANSDKTPKAYRDYAFHAPDSG